MPFRKLFLPFLFVLLNMTAGISAEAQNPKEPYSDLWHKTDDYISKGLPKSALAQTDKIYNLAKKDNNDVQVIKCLLYKSNLAQQIQEDGLKDMIDSLQSEIKGARQTERAILLSILAQLYQNYFVISRYRLYSVSNTQDFQKNDIATWSISDFQNKISSLYLESLQEPSLKKISLKPYSAIIEKGNAGFIRPTLFDLLAHRALDYFKSPEIDIMRPAFTFEIDDPGAFADAADFAKEIFQSPDSTSLRLNAIRLFQELIALHISDPKPLIDVDLERLLFVYQNATTENKDSLYLNALKNIYANYEDPEAAMAGYRAGELMYNKAFKNKNPEKMKEVVLWLKDVALHYPNAAGNIQSKNLLAEIQAPMLSMRTEKVNVPNIPFRSLVTYRNLDRMFLRVIPVTRDQMDEIDQMENNQQQIYKFQSLPFTRQWEQLLPDTKDYLTHNAEINTGSLPVGEYIILASADKEFSTARNVLTAQHLYVSGISYIHKGNQFFVLDRTTGKPLPDALIKPWRKTYNYEKRKYIIIAQNVIHADKDGYFSLKDNNKPASSLVLEITNGKDHLFMDDYQQLYYYNPFTDDNSKEYKDQEKYDEENANLFLFSDRSIYRPGQVVFFKGIGITRNIKSGANQLLQYQDSITLYLVNANNETIDSIRVKFNDFGSFNGRFQLPQNQLTGRFEISAEVFNNKQLSFSVEEYKRPKFYVEFEKAKASHKVGDTMLISGSALAYSGNNIDGAVVSYRVTRIPRFLYPWFFWRRGLPQTRSMEITHGKTITDASGKFTVAFRAIPDKSLDPATDPVFDYRITADVTDINGETRSTQITVPVGYKMLDLQIQLATHDSFVKDSLKNITLVAKNLSGELQNTKAHLSIYQLNTPTRLMRDRLWEEPDTTVMTKEAFIKLFPHDVYRDENMPESWTRKGIVFDKTDSLKGTTAFALHQSLAAGWYVAEATAFDASGNAVKDVRYFQVIDPQSKSVINKEYFIVQSESKNYQPGDTAHLLMATASDIHLISQVERINYASSTAINDFEHTNIRNGFKEMRYLIGEKDRGGFGISQFFVKDNRFYQSESLISVPWRNKQLDISFDTYREKTRPGSEEEWKVTVNGYKGEKAAAEMLASMYDASLDQFIAHHWDQPNPWPQYISYNRWQGNQNFSIVYSSPWNYPVQQLPVTFRYYDKIKYLYGVDRIYSSGGIAIRRSAANSEILSDMDARKEKKEITAPALNQLTFADSTSMIMQEQGTQPGNTSPDQPLRTNFNETAFFYPELKTDSSGNISFSFTMPDALTRWKMMLQAHTRDLSFGYAQKTVITQKDLMVIPNPPRFFREGDKITFSAKVVNMTDREISGNTEFHLLNASTMNSVDQWFQNNTDLKPFTIAPGQSALVTFQISIPENFNDVVAYRIAAKADGMSDGEEAFIPVVSNRIMVTESMPLPIKGNETKTFEFEKLLKSGNSSTLTNYGLTVEYTPNPAWYAVQALPYLNTYPYECTEQVFNRYFANALAMHISNSSPRLKSVFEKWKIEDTAALQSNLQKNQELKSVLLEETPWVLQAKNETEQKRNIALLFDLVNMSNQLDAALAIVKDRQTSNGGFSWFNAGPDDRFITQYILTDMGHLKKLNGWPDKDTTSLREIVLKSLKYSDDRIAEDYANLKRRKADLKINQLSNIAIYYLYARSFFPEIAIPVQSKEAYNYYFSQAEKYWLQQSKYLQGMIALTLFRNGKEKAGKDIVKSLRENAIVSPELGMYWKEWNRGGYWWYQAPVESQALMIEVFSEVTKDEKAVGELKTWLLINKQTNNWATTKATAEAVYALLLEGTSWLSENKEVKIRTGGVTFDSKNEKQEEGTGYFKRTIEGHNVKPDMGNITVTVSDPSGKQNESPSWGAVYWQYFENSDKITFAETPLKLSKNLFVETNTDRGPVLTPVNEGDKIHPGDKIKVRIELRVDRDMEYVHMKDMRASCMEPVNVLSGYKWQGGLGYYESTKDVSTNFFFSYLPKGTYVFEYPVFVTHKGEFSNGITTIQCMYAPEFTAHSEGKRVIVD